MSMLRKSNATLFMVILLGSLNISHSVSADQQWDDEMVIEATSSSETMHRKKADYLDVINDGDALKEAIAASQEPTRFLFADDLAELEVDISGEFVGLGVQIIKENEFVKVISTIDNTPAQLAGIQADDLIIRLNDAPVKRMSLNEAINIMRGLPGTIIKLTIVRKGKTKPIRITLQRAAIKVTGLKKRVLKGGFGYIQITHFYATTATALKKAILALQQGKNDRLKGLILDLRNNPGGKFNVAVLVSDMFLTKGLIVYTKGKVADFDLKYKATPGDILKHAPIVVLVNGGSTGAAEIVAGALQDHKRAVIMGARTFGFGKMQTVVRMANKSGIMLTTARFYTPSGRSIQQDGIIPDIELEGMVHSTEDDYPLKEAVKSLKGLYTLLKANQ